MAAVPSGETHPAHAAQDLIDRGDPEGALALLDHARAAPDADILAARASALLALGEHERALEAAQAARRLSPGNAAAAFNEGRALMAMGAPDRAAAAFAAAAAAFPHVAEIAYRHGEAAYLSGDAAAAEASLARALSLAPGHPAGFHLLAELLSQRADPAAIDRFLDEAVRRGGAAAFCASSTLLRLGRHDAALAALAAAEAASPPAAAFDMLGADILREQGRIGPALARARSAAARGPADAAANAPLARLLLMTGAASEALALSRRILTIAPLDQLWLAFLWTSLAALRSPEAERLLDFDRDVVVTDLPPPEGFPSLAAFNDALAAELAPLHEGSGPPLGQSVRGGTQTRRPLQSARTPAIAAFFRRAVAATADFAGSLPDDPGHPFHGRRTASLRISGAWSVRLSPGGRHAAHVHPGGWISSAYYVDLPPVEQAARGRLLLGEPPFPVDGLSAPRRTIGPAPGRLALFPSYCWHAVAPFAGPGRRLTIAFDITPAKARAAASAAAG